MVLVARGTDVRNTKDVGDPEPVRRSAMWRQPRW